MITGPAIVLTNGWLNNLHAKTCHGLLRTSDRFEVLGVIDRKFAGKDAGEVMDGKRRNIAVYADIPEALEKITHDPGPRYAIVGVAVHGGKLPDSLRAEVLLAMQHGLSIVCGLHSFLSDDPEFSRAATAHKVSIHDIRRPRPTSGLSFWSGEIYNVRAARIAVLGTDCALGKRTTAQFLTRLCIDNGLGAQMIYTGQTGWLQGSKYGFIFDATVNDFIGGEIEQAIVTCDKETHPDVVFIEGQSSLRNPSGPCGSEFILSGDARGVILQHAPGRLYFEGHEDQEAKIPTLAKEIALIKMYGAEVLGVSLSEEAWNDQQMRDFLNASQQALGIPVVRPLVDGVNGLLPAIQAFIRQTRK